MGHEILPSCTEQFPVVWAIWRQLVVINPCSVVRDCGIATICEKFVKMRTSLVLQRLG